jgi:hypothetical protein
VGDLEINQDLRFQRRMWALQRIGWAVMALVVLVGLLGLFGTGPLSSATAGQEEGPLFVEEYERFVRFRIPTTLQVRLDPLGTGEARLWLDREYLEGVQLQTVTPEPDSVEAGPDGFTYVFKVNDPNRPTSVTFHLQPETIGRLEGRVVLDGGEPVDFEQFVYP